MQNNTFQFVRSELNGENKNKSMDASEKRPVVIRFVFIGCIITAFLILVYFNNKRFERRNEVISAIVTDHGTSHKADLILYYEFNILGKAYKGEAMYSIGQGNYSDFLNKKFPVIYEKDHPDNSGLLLSPYDFKEYNIPYPDSLKWVKEKYFKGK